MNVYVSMGGGVRALLTFADGLSWGNNFKKTAYVILNYEQMWWLRLVPADFCPRRPGKSR